MKPQEDRIIRVIFGGVGLALFPLLLAFSATQDSTKLGPGPVAETAAELKPGQFLWSPRLAPAGPMLMIINLKTQRAVVYRNGIPIGISTVSTGKPGHETPAGVYAILQKRADHRSSLYDDAPMPFMQRLTWDGIALHGGLLPGYPASHGCIRLPQAFARAIFAETQIGMMVVVTRLTTMPTMAMTNAVPLMTPRPVDVLPTSHATKDRSPLSIIVSIADREVRIIREGREIGAAPVTIRQKLDTPIAFQLQADATWARLPLPGQNMDQMETTDANAIEVDDAFRDHVLSMAASGTTVLVVSDGLRPELSTAEALLTARSSKE